MKFHVALRRELEGVDESNYRDKLEALRDQEGSWQKVAEAIGVPRSTLYDWRTGYTRHGRAKRSVPSAGSLDKIKAALRASRPAQLAGIRDWKKLHVVGTIRVGGMIDPRYRRHENMYMGRYFPEDAFEGLARAYAAGDDQLVDDAMDFAVGAYYIQDFATVLEDVDVLDFGR